MYRKYWFDFNSGQPLAIITKKLGKAGYKYLVPFAHNVRLLYDFLSFNLNML
jgi:hypothetical protein